jgi:hypothetical protein
MITFTHNDWHGWQSNGQFLLSDENVKHLRYFADTDAAITWLYLEGYRDAARALNTASKLVDA